MRNKPRLEGKTYCETIGICSQSDGESIAYDDDGRIISMRHYHGEALRFALEKCTGAA
jgi:hypothetical protein